MFPGSHLFVTCNLLDNRIASCMNDKATSRKAGKKKRARREHQQHTATYHTPRISYSRDKQATCVLAMANSIYMATKTYLPFVLFALSGVVKGMLLTLAWFTAPRVAIHQINFRFLLGRNSSVSSIKSRSSAN